ncbi:DNA starvation/stationary phase protection protein [Xanthobacter dioxanivorans]|uniref:DNA starvation/stationary phase protection protein n=1 Tax=Xanthobacter dioxanivorans TaxID=2528964 RepID=A0A974PKI3_9HYPH|nr:DNA starvation/stationary phase protection protein [Xanthobacter dioxanivorans]QRG05265.1 DNA starvation/stationary phase protection protein [Xanthobacter dioxanivorans]
MSNVRSLSKKTAKPSAVAATAALATPTDLDHLKAQKVADALNRVLADTFVLYLKTKNFHWHVSGKHFRDYHLLLDEQASAIEETIDPLAERVRKIGCQTVHSYGEILKLTGLKENNAAYVAPEAMFTELIADNKAAIKSMRAAHEVADDAEDIATASLLEEYVDEAEKRLWFLFETNQNRQDSAT